MRSITKSAWGVAIVAGLAVGVAGCDSFPLPDVSLPDVSLPVISIPPLPEGTDPAPTVTVEVTVTADPAPAPTVTETVTADPGQPAPAPTVTETVTAEPGQPAPAPTVTEPAAPVPTVTVTVLAEPSASAEPSPSVTPSVSATPSATASPEVPDEDGGVGWWPWLLGGLLALVLAVIWTVGASRRRAWESRLDETRGVVSWLEGTVVPQLLSDPDAGHAVAQWEQARPHTLRAERSLYDLHGEARKPLHATQATDGLHAVQALTAAVDAEFVADAASDAESVRTRRAALEAARSQVREWLAATGK